MNRREFLLSTLGRLVPGAGSIEQRVAALEVRDQEIEAALLNQSNARYLCDQAILELIDPKLGITYYGTILRDYAKEEE